MAKIREYILKIHIISATDYNILSVEAKFFKDAFEERSKNMLNLCGLFYVTVVC